MPEAWFWRLEPISLLSDPAKSPERGSLDRADGRGKACWLGGVGLFRRALG